MRLHEFPAAIAHAQRQLLEAEQIVRESQEQLNQAVARVDIAIAFNEQLKNDAQRKAERLKLMGDPRVEKFTEIVNAARVRQVELQIEVDCLLNRFAVGRLAKQMAIAKLGVQSNAAWQG